MMPWRLHCKFYKIKIFNMRFVYIPSQGASWRERLEYYFSTDTAQPIDVSVEIIDATSLEVIGSMRLYNVTKGRVNIAPYIASQVSLVPVRNNGKVSVYPSPSAIAVIVRINGVESESRLFFRSKFNPAVSEMLTEHRTSDEVEFGDVVRLTIHAKEALRLTVSYNGVAGMSPYDYSVRTNGFPMEVTLPTRDLKEGAEMVVTARYEDGTLQSVRYKVVPRGSSSCRLLWYNPNGGIETYTFCHRIRLGYGVDVRELVECDGKPSRLVDGRVEYRLCSGSDSSANLERVARLLLSPVVYKERGVEFMEVTVDSREVAFDSKGQLHVVSLDISEKWKGGELW